MSTKKSPKYTNEFKQTIVNLYHSGKNYSQINHEYGISHSALAKKKRSARRGKSYLKKSHCNIHSTLRQRLIAVQILSHEHHISTLCRVLRVNRSTYYKFLNHTPSARDKDNAYIRSCIIAKSCRFFFYLCVILDLFSRKVIAYKLSLKNDSKLALGSLYGCPKPKY